MLAHQLNTLSTPYYTETQVKRLLHNTQQHKREMAIRFRTLRDAVKPVAELYDNLRCDQVFSSSGIIAMPRDYVLDLMTAYGIATELDTRRYPSVYGPVLYGNTRRYDLH